MRRGVIVVAVLVTLGAAGCAVNQATSRTVSAAVATGSVVGTGQVGSSAGTASVQATADSVPGNVFEGTPGVDKITLASEQPIVTRERAIALSRKWVSQDATFVSATCVKLPTTFMRAVLSEPKKAKPALAWLVLYKNVAFTPSGGAYVTGRPATQSRTIYGEASMAIDATTGELLMEEEHGDSAR